LHENREQRPEFEEHTLVREGTLLVQNEGASLAVKAGQESSPARASGADTFFRKLPSPAAARAEAIHLARRKINTGVAPSDRQPRMRAFARPG
jgi:hypothetical protein